jgi:hypothetical protein
MFHMTFPCFLNLVQLIQQNPIFYNNSCNPQRDPPIQIAVAVCRLGSDGNSSAIYRFKNLFQVVFGTIDLYTRQVIHAIYKLWSSLVTWPTKSEQIESSQVMQEEGFPGCVGFVDGTTIPLSQKPPKDGQHYSDLEMVSGYPLSAGGYPPADAPFSANSWGISGVELQRCWPVAVG